MRIASLPMYDLPELRDDHEAFWRRLGRLLAGEGIVDTPEKLAWELDPEVAWRHPALLLSQTCGYPFAKHLTDTVRLVATPCYEAPGCEGPRYRSWIVARDGDGAASVLDFRGRRAVINSADSLSGCKALEMMLPRDTRFEEFFAEVLCSGSHAASLVAIARGEADVAAIDCVTYDLVRRHRSHGLDGLRVVTPGPLLPALPLVTRITTTDAEVETMRRSLFAVVHAEDFAEHRHRLGLDGFEVLGKEDYLEILDLLAGARAG